MKVIVSRINQLGENQTERKVHMMQFRVFSDWETVLSLKGM